MLKRDLRKELKHLYAPSAKAVALVDVPPLQFAMVDGAIESGSEPGVSPGFSAAVQAVYGVSYTLKFMSKQRAHEPVDYTVMGLEALWFLREGEFRIDVKDNWDYTVLILQPDHITPEMFEEARAQVRKKRGDTPELSRLRLERFHEGLCVQIMHIGPYKDEPATVAKMDAFAAEHGYRMTHRHHEIYLGDPRQGDPAKLKTVLRHPVEKISA